MHISNIFAHNTMTCSFEFFPPKSKEASEALYHTIADLALLNPSFVDITYGAGGSTRQLTHNLVLRIHQQTTLNPIPHLTTVCHNEREIRQMIESYAQSGICNILALSGDLPHDQRDWDRSKDAFRYAAELVHYIAQFNQSGQHPNRLGFGIGVAGFPEGHPATPNRLLEMDYLKAKVDAGADYICTQLFFENRDFYDFRDRCELAGITVPIIAGLMPITNVRGMRRMAELAAGVRYPAALLQSVERCSDDAEVVKQIGIDWATEQCRDLLAHQVRGLHFYTLNHSAATRQIYETLELDKLRGTRDT